jgi:ketosteroid isomerase-like protein
MSEVNVETVRRDITARKTRDWTGLEEIWHPEIELQLVRGSGIYRGAEEMTRFLDGLSDLYSEYRVEADEIIEGADQVVTVERVAGRGLKGSNSGNWVQETLFRVWSFKNGKIWRIREYPTRAEALEAAGLSE